MKLEKILGACTLSAALLSPAYSSEANAIPEAPQPIYSQSEKSDYTFTAFKEAIGSKNTREMNDWTKTILMFYWEGIPNDKREEMSEIYTNPKFELTEKEQKKFKDFESELKPTEKLKKLSKEDKLTTFYAIYHSDKDKAEKERGKAINSIVNVYAKILEAIFKKIR